VVPSRHEVPPEAPNLGGNGFQCKPQIAPFIECGDYSAAFF
jgi:hypothetical protein